MVVEEAHGGLEVAETHLVDFPNLIVCDFVVHDEAVEFLGAGRAAGPIDQLD